MLAKNLSHMKKRELSQLSEYVYEIVLTHLEKKLFFGNFFGSFARRRVFTEACAMISD